MGIKTLKVVNNDFSFVDSGLEVLTGADALAQIIKNRLSMWLGEWFPAPLSGIDYLGLFNQNVFLEERARIIFTNAILADSRITKITKMEIELDNETRELTVDFVAESTEGLIAGTVTT